MIRVLLALILLLFASPAWATTYYVRTDGNNGNTGTVNSAGGAWLTIDYAADHVSAGDTVRVQAGTYGERVTPGVEGTAGNQVTFVADGSVTVCGFDFTNNDYIRVIGFVMDTNAGGCTINNGAVVLDGTNTYLEFWDNTFRDATYNAIRCYPGTMSDALVIGNIVTNMINNEGGGTGFAIVGDHNLISYNEIYGVDTDVMFNQGTYNRFINNYSHDMIETAGHPDFMQNGNNDPWSYNLFESNLQIGTPTNANEHQFNLENPYYSSAYTNNIWRRHVAHQLGSGGGVHTITQGFTKFRYYHNTTATASVSAGEDNEGGISMYGTGLDDTYLFNNLDYQSWTTLRTTGVRVYAVDTGDVIINYNLAYSPGGSVTFGTPWTSQANPQSNVNPNFANYGSDDFTLAAGSGDGANARGTGGPLTTTSGSGTGTTFNVVTDGAGFFVGDDTALSQYGGNLVVGDTITVGTDVLTIASISGDAITVTESFTWANGDAVYFGNDTTPDIGAYPYKAGGYALTATYTNSGGNITVTPSDASLVRWVVCFDDGIPTTVDNSSPYTCTVSGTPTVKVYSLYASKTPVITASEVAGSTTSNMTGGTITGGTFR